VLSESSGRLAQRRSQLGSGLHAAEDTIDWKECKHATIRGMWAARQKGFGVTGGYSTDKGNRIEFASIYGYWCGRAPTCPKFPVARKLAVMLHKMSIDATELRPASAPLAA
jgi:hypothetical protein